MKYLIRYKKLAVKWLDKKRGFVKQSTYANYACIIHNHIIPILGNYYLRNISNELLQNFIIRKCQEGRLDSSGGLSDKAIKDIVSVLKSSIRYAIKNGYMKYIDLEFYYPTNCIRLGCDYKTVSELLGHSSVNMTLNIYVHFQMSQKKRCINAMY